jgi:hypothetical protein
MVLLGAQAAHQTAAQPLPPALLLLLLVVLACVCWLLGWRPAGTGPVRKSSGQPGAVFP